MCGSGVEVGGVDGLVECVGFVFVEVLHAFDAALTLEPVGGEHEEIDAEAGGSVEHGVGFDVALVAEDAGEFFGRVFGEVFANDDEGYAGGSHVFLGAGVDDAEFCDVDFSGHDVGGHVGDEGGFGVGEGLPLRAGDGFVGGDVEVGGSVGFGKFGGDRDFAGAVGVGVGDDVYVADGFGFGDGFFCPGAGVCVVGGLSGCAEVHGDLGELLGGAALQEEDCVVFGYAEEFSDVCFGLCLDGDVFGTAVAGFEDGDSGVIEVEEVALCFFEHGFWEYGGACTEIEYVAHG